jgi:NAD(P)-dependent dehydrogenase (short-subunit alcohol dehydrogenase family)
MREAAGVKTKDGQGGMVWSTNVLSGYVMVRHLHRSLRGNADAQCKELLSHLEASPASLPFEPRVIHTSSRTAELRALDANVLSDPQLIKAPKTYAASKYLATLMMVHFDRMSRTAGSSSEGQQSRSVRCVNVDPGSVRTNVMDEGFKAEGSGLAIYIAIMRWGYWLAFTFVSSRLGVQGLAHRIVQICSWFNMASRIPGERIPRNGIRFSARPPIHASNQRLPWTCLPDLGQALVTANCGDQRRRQTQGGGRGHRESVERMRKGTGHREGICSIEIQVDFDIRGALHVYTIYNAF